MSVNAVDVAGLVLSGLACALSSWAVWEARGARQAAQSSARAAGRASLRAEDSAYGRKPDARLDIPDPGPQATSLADILDEEGLDMTEHRDPDSGRVRIKVYRRDEEPPPRAAP